VGISGGDKILSKKGKDRSMMAEMKSRPSESRRCYFERLSCLPQGRKGRNGPQGNAFNLSGPSRPLRLSGELPDLLDDANAVQGNACGKMEAVNSIQLLQILCG
jgi:hypothetical protein